MSSLIYLENMNGGRFETWNTKPEMEVYQVKQVHGTDIVPLKSLPAEADGMVTTLSELDRPLAIKTADCMPIVVEGEKGVVFLHAGWRGLAGGILKRPEVTSLGPQRVLIGPCIHRCCFEVSPDFKENFKDSPFFEQREKKLFFDLPQEAKRQLREKFNHLLVEIVPICTTCSEKFHSHRRDQTKERNWNLYIKG